MQNKWIALAKLGLAEPGALPLVLRIKRTGKTFLGYPQLASLAANFKLLQNRSSDGVHIAEFGVGRGGSAMLLAWLVNRYGGKLTLLDVFGRIPPPTESDGRQALERYQSILENENTDYYGNLPNLEEIIREELGAICPLEQIEMIAGKYEDTLPNLANPGVFHLVHIDCDWYESSKVVLAYLKDHLHPQAIVQIDDYFHWPGSRQATDEAEWLRPYPRKRAGDALVIDLYGPAG
jgi:hypothetical protein